jgi:outer membrane protein assembly factor BamB
MLNSLILMSALAVPGVVYAQSIPEEEHHHRERDRDHRAVDVVTYHNDIARTGQNLNETVLTLANVNAGDFGKIAFLPVDGKVDGQPLYLSHLKVADRSHNVVFAATEHDSVFAFDADSGEQLWRVSLLSPGETPSDDHGCGQITPEIGVTSTPVIDRWRGADGVIYLVAMSKDESGNYHQRLHALDITTGAELFGAPVEIQATYPGNGANSFSGDVVFDPKQYAERVGLLLLNGVVYTGWTSHCDISPYTGWLIGYDAAALTQKGVLNLTPNGSEGSIWMSGAGLAADRRSNIYFLDANGTFDTTLDADGFPVNGDYGNGFLKISTSGHLAVADYFNPYNTVQESNADEDLGSGGALVLPDLKDAFGRVRHLAVGAGKDSNIYVVDRDAMGKFDANRNHNYQEISGAFTGGVFSMPAYFKHTVYYGAVEDRIKAFKIHEALLATSPTSQTGNIFGYPGATPSISAHGSLNGIVWAVGNGDTAVLHAYDAADLSQELYSSSQAGTRDNFGPGNKFITPTIADGKVFVGTTNGIAVFGLLH